jgi:hypothetical protein
MKIGTMGTMLCIASATRLLTAPRAGWHWSAGLVCPIVLSATRALTHVPTSPPKIRSVRIIENPFDDIVPRITAEEKRMQQKAREQSMREREEAARRKGAKKCATSVLSR